MAEAAAGTARDDCCCCCSSLEDGVVVVALMLLLLSISYSTDARYSAYYFKGISAWNYADFRYVLHKVSRARTAPQNHLLVTSEQASRQAGFWPKMNMAPNVGSVSVCSSGSRFSSSSSRFSRRSSAGAASGAANGSLDRPVRRRDVIRPMNITTTAAAAAAAEGSASGGDGSSSSDGRNDSEKSTLAGIVLSAHRGSSLRDRSAAASNADEGEKGETTTTAMPSPVTPPRDQRKQQQQQQLQNRRPAIPSRTGRDPDEIVRGKSRSKLLTRRRSGTGLDDGNDDITAAATLFQDPPGEEPSVFPIVKLDIIGSAVSNRALLPSSTTAMVLRRRRRRDAEPSTIDDAELFESSETSFGISSDSLDLSKDDFNCSNGSGSGSNNNNNNNNSSNNRRRRRSTSSHHRNSNVNVVRWVDTKNINNIAEVDVRVLKRYANSFVVARVQEDEDKMATSTTTTIRGIDPDEDIVFSSTSSASSSALDRHRPTTTTTNTNNIVNEEEVQTIITNSRLRIATISCGFKRSNYFVREDLDTRIYFSSIEDALGYMSVRGYSKMFGEEELEWRELFRRAHGVVKVSTQLCRERERERRGGWDFVTIFVSCHIFIS